jgi:sugar O-acyltransferase (sialic acid O-acetyltransferase NeuD family)
MTNPRRPAVVFGTGGFAEVVNFYLAKDSGYEVVGFTATQDAVRSDQFLGRPLRPFEEIERHFPPDQCEMFVAVGYAKLNRLRERFCMESRTKGYRLLTYVSSKATCWGDTKIGDNVFIFEDNTIQPFVSIGDGTVLWSGNHIGHHSRIGNYCFITSHVVVSGYCEVGDRTFIGVNAAIADSTKVAGGNLIGAGAVIEKSTAPGEAYIAERIKKFPKSSDWFFR